MFKWNYSNKEILNRKGVNKSLALFFAETAADYMKPYVPMDKGTLSNTYTTNATDTTGTVTYTQPYANKMFYNNYNFSKEKHPLATSRWDKAMLVSSKEKLTKAVSEYRKRLSK